METLWVDMQQAWRLVRRRPGISAVIVATLALAIGANAAIFSVLDASALRPLPYHAPDQLVVVTSVRTERSDAPFSLPEFLDYRRETKSLSGLAAYASWSANLTGEGDAERLQGVRISANTFELLGVRAAAGRLLVASDDDINAPKVAVISYALWQRRFGGRQDAIGTVLRLNTEPIVLVGVLPRSIPLPIRDVDLAVPLAPDRDPWRSDRTSTNFLRFIGRLRPGTSDRLAEQELTAICARLRDQYPREYANKRAVQVVGLQPALLGDTRRTLILLLGAAGVVLAIACANLANLLLMSATSRDRELAVRVALGATSSRLARQLATETLLLALLGGTIGLLVGLVGVKVLVALGPTAFPRLAEASIDWRVVGFTAAITIATAIVLGLVPIQRSRRPPVQALRGGRAATASRTQHRARAVLIAAEVASALLLLVGGGLLGQSLVRLQGIDLGFTPRGVFVARVSLPRTKYSDPQRLTMFIDRLERQLQQEPGVRRVGAVSVAPFSGLLAAVTFSVAGATPGTPADLPSAPFRVVTPGYFAALEVPLLRGRGFTEHDVATTPMVAVVSRAFVDRHLSGVDPVGHRLIIEPNSTAPHHVEVVGVVGNVTQATAEVAPSQDLYLTARQIREDGAVWLANNMFWTVRVSGDVESFEQSFRRVLHDVDPDAAAAVSSLERYMALSLGPRRFNVALMLLFALAATVLAATGLYAVVSYAVTQRKSEIALRMALGATPAGIYRLVARGGLIPVLVGLVVGLAVALASGSVLAGMLYAVRPTEPTVFAGATLLVVLIAVMAVAIPARRAAAVRSPLVFGSE